MTSIGFLSTGHARHDLAAANIVIRALDEITPAMLHTLKHTGACRTDV
jgi:hypothetical protein